MFGWGKKRDPAVVASVCAKLRPLFGVLEHRIGELPAALADDPYVIGYVIGASTIFAQVETNGEASRELRGMAALSGLEAAFSTLHFSQQQASAAMHRFASHDEAKRGARAANLVIGAAMGFTDKDAEPEVVAAKAAVASMPVDIRAMFGGTPQSLLMQELQEQLFFAPLAARYARDPAAGI